MEEYVKLSADAKAAKAEFFDLLSALDRGLIVVLGTADSVVADAQKITGIGELGLTLVYASNKSAISDLITSLVGGDEVNFGHFGHQVVSINKSDQVAMLLSRNEATSITNLLGAFWASAMDSVI